MAMTADSSTNNHSPRSPVTSVDGAVDSPQSRRRSLPSPWAQVVRGELETPISSPLPSPLPEQAPFSDFSAAALNSELPAVVAVAVAESQLESSDSSNGNVGRPKKPAWNKPLNGVVVEVGGPVMGADSWPALSESTRPSPKSSSESSSKPISDGSISVSQGPVISHSPQKQSKTNANTNSSPNHPHPVRQRSMKRGGGTGGGSSGFSRPPPPPPPPLPPPPPFPLFEMPYGHLVPAVLDSPIREPPYKGSTWVTRPMAGVGSQSHAVNDHSSHRNPSRRGNFGARSRGDGLYLNGYGGRSDQDRDWHAPRGSTTRDAHITHQMVPPPPLPPRGFIGPPHPGSTSFIAPQPMRSFGNPMGFDMASPFLYVPTLPPEHFRGAPLLSPATPPAIFYPVMDPTLPTLIFNQIEYYFSDANLVKDNYLRINMDDEGWVPISLIATFPRVQSLTNDIQLILDSLRDSTAVEVQGDKVRRRNEWRKWIRTSDRFPTDLGLQSPRGATDSFLATPFQKLAFDEETTNQNNTLGRADAHKERVPDDFSSVKLTDQSKLANGEVNTEACSSHI